MPTWAKCSDRRGETVWINLDNVTTMARISPTETEIIFVGGAQVLVRERPEDLTKHNAE
jgi:hypothetical protein